MQINYQALTSHLQKNMKAVYVLVGLDHYLLNDAALSIKKAWRQRGETDEKILHINAAADWKNLHEEAYSYSLFSELVLLDIRFDKKTIDAAGKDILNQYLKNINPRCLIILQASAVPAKQLQWLVNNEHVTLVQIASLTEAALQQWITTQLQNRKIRHAPHVPSLIHQYSQNNMLACAQIVEKLALIYEDDTELTIDEVTAQLIDQCDFQLYDLADACLSANAEKALHLLRQACNTRGEPTLILWILTQEIRQLIQLSHLLKQRTSFATACTQLRIWPKRTKLYEKTLTRLPLPKLYQLLSDSEKLDERIKTSQGSHIWQAFETLALSLCLG
jgi:DNA polymerase-3 subunit delta